MLGQPEKNCKRCRKSLDRILFVEKGQEFMQCNACRAAVRESRKTRAAASSVPRPKLRNRYTLEDCRKLAADRGGRCLSTEYKTTSGRIEWECKLGHRWTQKFNAVLNMGIWCQLCKRVGIDRCKAHAEAKGGECLSAEYENNSSKLRWRCSKAHEWEATWWCVRGTNSWCPECSLGRLDLEECKKWAEINGGECLAATYQNSREKLSWKCRQGHTFEMDLDHVRHRKQWCPYCSTGRSEKMTRSIFKELLQDEFPKKKPSWLQGLELDGFCEEKKLAFEYQGEQHYRFVRIWHRTEEGFKNLQQRDQRKYETCVKQGVALILVPYKFDYKNEPALRTYIKDQLIERGFLKP